MGQRCLQLQVIQINSKKLIRRARGLRHKNNLQDRINTKSRAVEITPMEWVTLVCQVWAAEIPTMHQLWLEDMAVSVWQDQISQPWTLRFSQESVHRSNRNTNKVSFKNTELRILPLQLWKITNSNNRQCQVLTTVPTVTPSRPKWNRTFSNKPIANLKN